MLTFGSLFAGIGGMDLGLERTGGFRTVWQVEIDPYCQRVLAKHWPEVRRHDDVRTFPPTAPEEWGCDLICGGFPCQDISNAGKRAGIDGERSGLWSEFARVIGVVRPRLVLVENVAALLGRGLGRVLGDLAALGYDAEWDCVPACAVGAHHERDRVFVVGHARSFGHAAPLAPRVTKQGRCLSREVKLFPTPVVGDSRAAMNRLSKRQPGSKHHDGVTLTDFVRLFPTPSSRDWKGEGFSGQLPTELHGVPNPEFVEWLLGLPSSWTDLGS